GHPRGRTRPGPPFGPPGGHLLRLPGQRLPPRRALRRLPDRPRNRAVAVRGSRDRPSRRAAWPPWSTWRRGTAGRHRGGAAAVAVPAPRPDRRGRHSVGPSRAAYRLLPTRRSTASAYDWWRRGST